MSSNADDTQLAAGRNLLKNLHTASSDPSLFSHSYVSDLRRRFSAASLPAALTSTRPITRTTSADRSTLSNKPAETLPRRSFSSSPPGSSKRRRRSPVASGSAAEQDNSRTHHPEAGPSSPRSARLKKDAMTTLVSSGQDDLWLPPHHLRSPAQITFREDVHGVRKACLPQTREIYVHPSQITSIPSLAELDFRTDMGFSDRTESGPTTPASAYPPIVLPPILTLDEIEKDAGIVPSQPPTPAVVDPAQVSPRTSEAARTLQSANSIARGLGSREPAPVYTPQSISGPPPAAWPGVPPPPSGLDPRDYPPPPPGYYQYYPGAYPGHPGDIYGVPHPGAPPVGYEYDVPTGFPGQPHGRPQLSNAAAYPGGPSIDSGDGSGGQSPERSPPSTASGGSPERPGSAGEGGSTNEDKNGPANSSSKRTGKLPAAVTAHLKQWLMAHTAHPYPSEDEKKAMCKETGLSMNQVSNWFINARRRILPSLAMGQGTARRHMMHGMPPHMMTLPQGTPVRYSRYRPYGYGTPGTTPYPPGPYAAPAYPGHPMYPVYPPGMMPPHPGVPYGYGPPPGQPPHPQPPQ